LRLLPFPRAAFAERHSRHWPPDRSTSSSTACRDGLHGLPVACRDRGKPIGIGLKSPGGRMSAASRANFEKAFHQRNN